jgi:hypothetical protein
MIPIRNYVESTQMEPRAVSGYVDLLFAGVDLFLGDGSRGLDRRGRWVVNELMNRWI